MSFTSPPPMWEKNDKKLYKQRAQVKSRFYYLFWGIATVSVVLGQVYVGAGYRAYAGALLRIFDAIEIEVGRSYQQERFYQMRLTQEVIDKIQLAMTHTKMNGETNWKDGDEIDVCLGGKFAGDKFISIINRTRSNTTKQ